MATQTEVAPVERLLTVPETANRLATTAGTVRNWIRRGRLHAVRLGRAVRLREADIRRIVDVGFHGNGEE